MTEFVPVGWLPFLQKGKPFSSSRGTGTPSVLVIYLPIPMRRKSNRYRLGFLVRWQVRLPYYDARDFLILFISCPYFGFGFPRM